MHALIVQISSNCFKIAIKSLKKEIWQNYTTCISRINMQSPKNHIPKQIKTKTTLQNESGIVM